MQGPQAGKIPDMYCCKHGGPKCSSNAGGLHSHQSGECVRALWERFIPTYWLMVSRECSGRVWVLPPCVTVGDYQDYSYICIALNMTPNTDCYNVGSSPKVECSGEQGFERVSLATLRRSTVPAFPFMPY